MVTDLLEQLQPARLNPAEQVIEIVEGETWVKLRHDRDPGLEIRFVVNEGWIHFYGVMGHDEAYSTRSEAPESWTRETVDILADLLLAGYSFETFKVRGMTWREVLAIGEPYNHVLISGPMPASLLPLQRWARVASTRRSSFECQGSRKSDPPASSPARSILIERLRARPPQSWSDRALLACLERLAAGGPTGGHLIHVHDAWPLDDADGICVIYNDPGGRTIGLRVLRTSSSGHPLYLNAAAGDMNNPDDFGHEVADYVIAEPLGTIADQLVEDSDGVGWWGEQPFPDQRPPNIDSTPRRSR